MSKVNGHAYPLHDDKEGQEEVYDYWRERDLEELLKKEWVRDEIETGQRELELVLDEV